MSTFRAASSTTFRSQQCRICCIRWRNSIRLSRLGLYHAIRLAVFGNRFLSSRSVNRCSRAMCPQSPLA